MPHFAWCGAAVQRMNLSENRHRNKFQSSYRILFSTMITLMLSFPQPFSTIIAPTLQEWRYLITYYVRLVLLLRAMCSKQPPNLLSCAVRYQIPNNGYLIGLPVEYPAAALQSTNKPRFLFPPFMLVAVSDQPPLLLCLWGFFAG